MKELEEIKELSTKNSKIQNPRTVEKFMEDQRAFEDKK
jgi:hypothetical protein